MSASGAISAIIPVLNRHDRIAEAVRSVGSELESSDEIIVVDDGSTPPIEAAALGSVRPALRLVRNEANHGPANARNLGLAHAGGSLIAFLDSDDRWLPGKIETQRRTLAAAGGDMIAVACSWREVDARQRTRERTPRASVERGDFFAGCWFAPGSTLLIPASVFHRIGGFDERLRRLEDYDWFLRFAMAGGRLVVAQTPGVKIVRGTNAAPAHVENAATIIAAKIKVLPDLRKSERQDALSYLNLERARAYANMGDWSRTALMLGRSLLQHPRGRFALRPWWDEGASGAGKSSLQSERN